MTEPISLLELETLAQSKLPETIFGYYVGGAIDEISLRDNRDAYNRMKLYPHVLRPASVRTTQTTILGHTFPTPIFIAPMATQKAAHPEGELGMARGAGAKGVTMIVSTMASYSLADIAEVATAPLWFQLYVYKDRAISEELVRRAEACGYQALVLTVDTPYLGRRERDVRSNYTTPKGAEPVNLPVIAVNQLDKNGQPIDFATYYRHYLRSDNMSWEDIAWLRSITKLPILLKGILRADDAQQAVALGADGIVVSNHGGRQLDTVPATLDVLGSITDAVDGRIDVLMDGGIRRGTDVVKALALGAKGVLVGRPMMWGLAYNGQAGVEHALQLLLDEFDLAMALCGCSNLADMTRDLLTPA